MTFRFDSVSLPAFERKARLMMASGWEQQAERDVGQERKNGCTGSKSRETVHPVTTSCR